MWYCIPLQLVIAAPRDIRVNGIDHPAAIFGEAWTDAERAGIGIVPYQQEDAPEGNAATAWEEGLEDGVWVRRATAWEPVPAPDPEWHVPPQVFRRRISAARLAGIRAASADMSNPVRAVIASEAIFGFHDVRQYVCTNADEEEGIHTLDALTMLLNAGLLEQADVDACMLPLQPGEEA